MTEFDKEAVRIFLRSFKRLARSPRRLHVLPTPENKDALIKLGLTKKNRREEILRLNVLDYSSGPDPNHNHPGSVWIFGTTIHSIEVYIKLKIVETERSTYALCMSFHPAARPLDYPFRD